MIKKEVNWVFISGCGHTGTTLLAKILSQSENIYCNNIENGQFLLYNFFETDKLITRFEDEARRYNKVYILEKTPRHAWHADFILSKLPKSKHIFTVREPIATINSLYKRTGNLDSSIRRYQDDCIQIIRNLNNPNTYLIKYEDLTSSPELWLKKLCNWLDIQYSSDFLNFYKSDKLWFQNDTVSTHESNRNAQLKNPIYVTENVWTDEHFSKSFDFNEWYKIIGKKIAEAFGYVHLNK